MQKKVVMNSQFDNKRPHELGMEVRYEGYGEVDKVICTNLLKRRVHLATRMKVTKVLELACW
jgi:hypothetical protein